MMAIGTAAGVRIAGAGGAGFFIEPLVLPDREQGLSLGLDIALLSPDRLVSYLARRVPGEFPERLSRFLREASIADEGESTDAFEEPQAGLLITVTAMDGMWVEFEVRIAQNLDEDVVEFDGLNFETSRASLLIAAEAAAGFAGSDSSLESGE